MVTSIKFIFKNNVFALLIVGWFNLYMFQGYFDRFLYIAIIMLFDVIAIFKHFKLKNML